MWGAIIGDLAGSIYEYEQVKSIKKVKQQETIPDKAFFSDDTILTIAILDAIEHDKDYEKYLKLYGKKYATYKPDFLPYFKTSFSPGFIKWLNNEKTGNSVGNGAMMRISPIGYLFESEEEVRKNSRLATIPSHNSEEAIKCSEIIALVIFYARKGLSKQEIIKKLNINPQYKPFETFNSTCSQTIDNCLYAVFTSNSFEQSINKVISYGGDTDTNACIVGSMAEAMFGIDSTLIDKAKSKLPKEFINILEKAYTPVYDVQSLKSKIEEILTAKSVEKSISENMESLLILIPEIKSMIGFEHKHPHHHLDVWQHTLEVLKNLNTKDLELNMAALLHDIGKPFSYQDEEVRHFHGHAEVSCKMTQQILTRLGYDEEFIKRVSYLVETHDTIIEPNNLDNNSEMIQKRLQLQYADAKAHHPDKVGKRIKFLDDIKNKLKVLENMER